MSEVCRVMVSRLDKEDVPTIEQCGFMATWRIARDGPRLRMWFACDDHAPTALTDPLVYEARRIAPSHEV